MKQSIVEGEWVVVIAVSGMIRADIIRGRLETENIPVKLRFESAGKIYGLTVDGLGEVEVLVPAEYREQALEILRQSFYEEELPWDKERSE